MPLDQIQLAEEIGALGRGEALRFGEGDNLDAAARNGANVVASHNFLADQASTADAGLDLAQSKPTTLDFN